MSASTLKRTKRFPLGTSHDWRGPQGFNRHVHCARCGKIFEVLKSKGICYGQGAAFND